MEYAPPRQRNQAKIAYPNLPRAQAKQRRLGCDGVLNGKSGNNFFADQIRGPFPERAFEPEADRSGKTLLRPLKQIVGHVAAQHPFQYAFGAQGTRLHCRRQTIGELDDPVVENWHPDFQRNRHARPVDLRQYVVREVACGVHVLLSFSGRQEAVLFEPAEAFGGALDASGRTRSQNDFRSGMATEPCSPALKLGPEFAAVVDFAVVVADERAAGSAVSVARLDNMGAVCHHTLGWRLARPPDRSARASRYL